LINRAVTALILWTITNRGGRSDGGVGTAQDGDFVAQHEELDVLG
jgi:hypothetical protein